ncbi:MAG: LEA type 2 family protein, partial [Bacteroidaceae bacterium]|nr:LEA type 2 family protein [Bacteroidaceae bacterium]
MASVFSDNINFIGDKPNFDRDKVTTLAQLACEDPKQKRYPYGHIVFCEEDGKHYKFNYNHKAASIDEGAKSDITGWFVPLDEPVDLTAINACVEQNSALISQESNRATTAETALADAVSINNHALQQEVSRATIAEDVLSGRISDSVGRIADIESVMSSSTEMLDTLENVAAWIQDDSPDSADIVAHVNENNEAIKKLQFQTHGVEVDVVGSQYAVTQAVMAGQNVTFRLLNTDNASFAYAIYVKYGEKGTSYHLGGKYISLGEVVSITATIDFDRVMLWAQGTTADEYKLLHVSSDSVTLLNQLSDIKTNVDTLHKRNIRQGLLKNGVPVLSKTAKTLTLPSGTLLLGGNKMLTLSSELVIDNTSDPDFGSHYIAIDLSSQAPAYRLIRSMSNITLNNDNEFIIALLDWSLGFVWVNSRTYIVDAVTYKKEIPLDTISDMQNDISDMQNDILNIDATLKKSQLETTGYEAVCLSSYTYFPAINRGDKIEITLLSDVGDANLAIYVSDKQYPPSGHAVNIGYLKTGGSVTLDVPDKFDSISYIKLWANGMDNIEKVVRIKSKGRTLAAPIVGKFYNVPLNLKKPNLKILDIGNSYTENATLYINNLLIHAGVTEDVQNHSHYIAVRGGASFKTWYDCYHDADKTTRYYIT